MPTPPAPSAPSAPSMPTTSLIPESFMPSAPSMPTPPAPPAPSAPSAPEAPSMPTPSMPTAPSMPTPPAPSAPSAPSAPTPSLIPESFMTSAPSMPTPPTPPAPSVSTPPAPSMPSAPSMPTPPAQNAPTPSLIPESFMTSAPSVPTPPAPTAPAIPAHIPPAVIASAEAQNSSTPPAQTLDQSSGDITITPIETSTLDIVELGPDTSEIIEQPLDEYLPQEEYSNDIDEITSNKTYGEEDWMTWISKEAATISAEIEEQEANQEPIEQEEDMLPINPISEDYAINYAPDNINREAPEPVLYYRRDLYPEPIQIDDNYDELYL